LEEQDYQENKNHKHEDFKDRAEEETFSSHGATPYLNRNAIGARGNRKMIKILIPVVKPFNRYYCPTGRLPDLLLV
jgi:hypothetical protein